MDGSPSAVITLGLGNGTFAPQVGLVLTLGLGIAEQDTSLIGYWTNIIPVYGNAARIECHGNAGRIEVR
jgi:hypothetical protein